jgi:cytochrome c553
MKKIFKYGFYGLLASTLLSACGGVKQYSENLNTSLSGKEIVSKTCAACHNSDGNSVSPQFPKLAGQQKDYLLAQLADFKGHQRSDSDGVEYMWGLARLTSVQSNEIADYFSTQKTKSSTVKADSVLVNRGEKIFKEGIASAGVPACAACHGERGAGVGEIPRLAGQHAEYMTKQIEIFQKTDQRPRGVAMKAITHQLSQQDIKDVTAYLSGLD